MTCYEEALELFGIKSGFVEEQLDELYSLLKEKYNPDAFEFLSPEYIETSDLRHKITMAYYTLHSFHRNYIVSNSLSLKVSNENLEDEILKLIQDSVKSGKEIDEHFFTSLIEIIVCSLGLNNYVRRIEFGKYDKVALAGYDSKSLCLDIYLSSVRESIEKSSDSRFSPLEKEYHPYCYVTTLIRHELEHANQKKMREQNKGDIITKSLLATEAHSEKMDKDLDKIVMYPLLIYLVALFLKKRKERKHLKIYRKNWHCAPTERLAEISAFNLTLDLIEKLTSELSNPLPILKENTMLGLEDIVIAGYDKHIAPALFYLERFKQYSNCLELLEMSKTLSLEERMALGFSISPTEKALFEQDPKKVLQKIRTMQFHK